MAANRPQPARRSRRLAKPGRRLPRQAPMTAPKQERRKSNLELFRRLEPVIGRATRGDFSHDVDFPATPDEFQNLYISIQLMLETIRQKITEEERGRSELADTVRQLRAVIRGSADGILVINDAGQIELINPALEDMTGWQADDIRGRTAHGVFDPHGEDGGVFDFGWLRNLTKRRKDHPPVRNATIKTKLGTTRWVGITAGPEVRDESGQHTVMIIRDIAEDRELRRRQREFVSITSHELRTPITAMLGYVSLIKSALQTGGGDLDRLVSRAYEATNRMSELVEDLLNVARLEEGRLKVRLVSTSPGPLVSSVIEELTPALNRKRISFRFNNRLSTRHVIKIDKNKFCQIVRNLLDNAIKYTPEGGRISIRMIATESRIRLTITDTGIGIHPENLTRIFEKFFREYTEGSVAAGGTGLGLFITKELVEHLGGKLRITAHRKDGKPGKQRGGTVATVSFPRSRRNSKNHRPKPPSTT